MVFNLKTLRSHSRFQYQIEFLRLECAHVRIAVASLCRRRRSAERSGVDREGAEGSV